MIVSLSTCPKFGTYLSFFSTLLFFPCFVLKLEGSKEDCFNCVYRVQPIFLLLALPNIFACLKRKSYPEGVT